MISVVKVAFSPRKRGIYISGMPPGGARGVPSVSPFGGYKMLLNSMRVGSLSFLCFLPLVRL